MDSEEQIKQMVKDLLSSQRFAVLSTTSEIGPYASLIAFWAAEDLRRVLFATMRATRKFNYLAAHPAVALLFDNRSNRDLDVSQAMAITAIGSARELTEPDPRSAALDEYLAKHPHLKTFAASPGCAIVEVKVDTYYVVTHFQSVFEFRLLHPTNAG